MLRKLVKRGVKWNQGLIISIRILHQTKKKEERTNNKRKACIYNYLILGYIFGSLILVIVLFWLIGYASASLKKEKKRKKKCSSISCIHRYSALSKEFWKYGAFILLWANQKGLHVTNHITDKGTSNGQIANHERAQCRLDSLWL